MIKRQIFPRTYEELRDAVVADARGCRSAVVQCGHFLLYYDIVEDCLVPCVATELVNPRHEGIKKEAGQFPGLTWQLGIDLLTALDVREKHAMIAVNDWQYVPAGIDRKRFYENRARLPDSYVAVLEAAEGKIALLGSERGNGSASPFFSEQTLRNQYLRHIKDLIRRGLLPQDVEVAEREDGAVCSLMDVLGRDREIYCASKGADCASEVAEMIDQAWRRTGCDLFINIFPSVCRQHVEVGSELPARVFGTKVRCVMNVALPAIGVATRRDLFQDACYLLHDLTD